MITEKISRGRPRGPTPQGDQTRARIYASARGLFHEQGYEGTTLRQIAQAAEVSPGLLYRYFDSKEALVFAIYQELTTHFTARPLTDGPWMTRGRLALHEALAVLAPERALLRALIPGLLGAANRSLYVEASEYSRASVRAVFVEVVIQATDAPEHELAVSLGRLLYGLHLGSLLFWLLDESPDQRATRRLLDALPHNHAAVSLILRMPWLRGAVHMVDDVVMDAFGR